MIEDPRGQWAHPGKNTRIPGNQITMKGVDYPVWAVPDVGEPVLMQPGQEYTFPGASYVDEYPMAEQEGEYEKKELTDAEIEEYVKGGYIVEEELPKAQKGFNKIAFDDSTKLNKWSIDNESFFDKLAENKGLLGGSEKWEEKGLTPQSILDVWDRLTKLNGIEPKPIRKKYANLLDEHGVPKNSAVKIYKAPVKKPIQKKKLPELTVSANKSDVIYVTDQNDPRLKEYKEKMHLYNLSKKHYLNVLDEDYDQEIENIKETIEYWKKNDNSQVNGVEDILKDLEKNKANLSGSDYRKHYRRQKGSYKVGDDLFDDVLAGKYDADKQYEGLDWYNELDDDNLRILKEGLKLGYKPQLNNIAEGYVNVEYTRPRMVKYAAPNEEAPKVVETPTKPEVILSKGDSPTLSREDKIVNQKVWMGGMDSEGNKIYVEQPSRVRRKFGGELPKAKRGIAKLAKYIKPKPIPKPVSKILKQSTIDEFLNAGIAKSMDQSTIDKFLKGTSTGFKSDIDWENWVKYKEDFHNNPDVIKHLNEIEEVTKANKTWMKNADGSSFERTPEEFVIERSNLFKKAFPDIMKKDGKVMPLIHHSPNEFNSFDEAFNLSGVGMNKYGPGIYTVPKPYWDDHITQDIFNLGSGLGQKPVLVSYGKNRYDLYTNDVGVNQFAKKDGNLLTGVSTQKIPRYKTDKHTAVIPYSNTVKSAKGNILFDTNNSNMYKALAPLMGIAGYDLLENKKEGGELSQDQYNDIPEFDGDLPEFVNSREHGIDTPIYVDVDIQPSKIKGAGDGLFSKQSVQEGNIIGVSHIRKQFKKNGEIYEAPFPSKMLGMYNHSDQEPNVTEVDNGDHISLIAIRDIQPGEELLSNYDDSEIQDMEMSSDFIRKDVPKAKDGGIVNCEDGQCEETNEVQKLLDRQSKLRNDAVNFGWGVYDQMGYVEGEENKTGNAEKIFSEYGMTPIGKKLPTVPKDQQNTCSYYAGQLYCNTDPTINSNKFLSNYKFRNAVEKGEVPFTKTNEITDPNFDYSTLSKGDIISIKKAKEDGGGNHMMVFSHVNDDGKPVYLQSDGETNSWDWRNKNYYSGKKGASTGVFQYTPYAKEIAELEEKARTNPTYLQDNQEGGFQLELTPEEIDKYVKGGYVVEELPKAQVGKVARVAKNIFKEGTKVNDIIKIDPSFVRNPTMKYVNDVFKKRVFTDEGQKRLRQIIQDDIKYDGLYNKDFNSELSQIVMNDSKLKDLEKERKIMRNDLQLGKVDYSDVVKLEENIYKIKLDLFSQKDLHTKAENKVLNKFNNRISKLAWAGDNKTAGEIDQMRRKKENNAFMGIKKGGNEIYMSEEKAKSSFPIGTLEHETAGHLGQQLSSFPGARGTTTDKILQQHLTFVDPSKPNPFTILKGNTNVLDRGEFDSNRYLEKALTYFKTGKSLNPDPTDVSRITEASAFLAEVRAGMVKAGILKDYYSPVNEQQVKLFNDVYQKTALSEKPTMRLLDITENTDKNFKVMSQEMNKLLGIAPLVGLGVAGSTLEEKKLGGELPKAWDGRIVKTGSKLLSKYLNPVNPISTSRKFLHIPPEQLLRTEAAWKMAAPGYLHDWNNKSVGLRDFTEQLKSKYDWRKSTRESNKASLELRELLYRQKQSILNFEWSQEIDDKIDEIQKIRREIDKNRMDIVNNYGKFKLDYSGLPITRAFDKYGHALGGGQGKLYNNLLNEKEYIKYGKYFGDNNDMQNLINVGKTYNNPLVEAAFPTEAFTVGDRHWNSGQKFVQFMPKLDYRSASLSISDNDKFNIIKDLSDQGVGIDYSGADNIGGVGDKLGLVDLTYIGKPGQRNSVFKRHPRVFIPVTTNNLGSKELTKEVKELLNPGGWGSWKEGGSVELGDEVDEATMERLKAQGYTFEEI